MLGKSAPKGRQRVAGRRKPPDANSYYVVSPKGATSKSRPRITMSPLRGLEYWSAIIRGLTTPATRCRPYGAEQKDRRDETLRDRYEKAATNYSAYVPDLPGCIATGVTVQETERLLREAIELHLAGIREDGDTVPVPTAVVEYIEILI
jgi:predicted RNase H-like HicB family nuclease